MSGTPEIKPALTAPEEESIGPRDLTHWRSRLGRSVARVVNRVVGAYAPVSYTHLTLPPSDLG